MGTTSTYLSEAEELLASARDESDKGYPAAALFETFEALVKANLALELVDGVTEDKVERYTESARASISESRNRGIEPVLAVSYFEYAQSLQNESAIDAAVVYYKLSDLIAGSLGFTSTSGDQSSRYVGIPESSFSIWELGPFRYVDLFLYFIAVGLLGGLRLGLIIGEVYNKKIKVRQSPQRERKKDAGKYQNKHFSGDEIPRSIKEYYKNMK